MIDDTLGLCGTVVAEKYEVLEAVGKGGFAIVYRARHLLWKRFVALKVFKELDSASTEGRKALTDDLIREASLPSELSEKTASICQARDLGMLTTPSGQSLPYMVLEWLEGQTLGATLVAERKAALPPRSLSAAATLLDPIAEALAVAHARGIAHRDVKPANVFLATDTDGKPVSVKLLDFGIAKVVQDAQKTGGAFEKTAGLVTAFTPNYGAPEQFSRNFGATGPWTDVYSLALVVVECAAGRRLIPGNDFLEMAKMATDTARRPSPRAFGLEVSDATEAVFVRALAVSPGDRFATVGAFWVALLGTLGIEPSRPMLAASAGAQGDMFAGIASARTALAPLDVPSAPALGPPGRVSVLPVPPASTRASGAQSAGTPTAAPPTASGRRVLAVLAALGVLFVVGLGLGLRYDQNDGPPPGASEEAPAPPSAAAARHANTRPASSGGGGAATGSAGAPKTATRCPDGMVLIPRGEFFMGSDDDTDGEKPAHHVDLSPYCIDLYEVTTARYAACSNEGKCKRAFRTNEWPGISAQDHDVFDPLCSVRDATSQAEHPIVCVDWTMASTFCGSLSGGRLPTEAEWEFAARGPDGRKYPWGDEAPGPELLNACGAECLAWAKEAKVPMTAMYKGDDGWPNTSQVGSFPHGRSTFGLFDVAGNVWEWVADWHAPYGKAREHDPTGPATGKLRVIRGGAWNGGAASWVRPTFRFMNAPESRSYGIGFRCAATPT